VTAEQASKRNCDRRSAVVRARDASLQAALGPTVRVADDPTPGEPPTDRYGLKGGANGRPLLDGAFGAQRPHTHPAHHLPPEQGLPTRFGDRFRKLFSQKARALDRLSAAFKEIPSGLKQRFELIFAEPFAELFLAGAPGISLLRAAARRRCRSWWRWGQTANS